MPRSIVAEKYAADLTLRLGFKKKCECVVFFVFYVHVNIICRERDVLQNMRLTSLPGLAESAWRHAVAAPESPAEIGAAVEAGAISNVYDGAARLVDQFPGCFLQAAAADVLGQSAIGLEQAVQGGT